MPFKQVLKTVVIALAAALLISLALITVLYASFTLGNSLLF